MTNANCETCRGTGKKLDPRSSAFLMKDPCPACTPPARYAVAYHPLRDAVDNCGWEQPLEDFRTAPDDEMREGTKLGRIPDEGTGPVPLDEKMQRDGWVILEVTPAEPSDKPGVTYADIRREADAYRELHGFNADLGPATFDRACGAPPAGAGSLHDGNGLYSLEGLGHRLKRRMDGGVLWYDCVDCKLSMKSTDSFCPDAILARLAMLRSERERTIEVALARGAQ